MLRVVNVVGARPNLIKIGPLVAEMARHAEIEQTLVHTGQHYDENMSGVFFEELGIPEPDLYLGVGSGSHAEQTGRIMTAFERAVTECRPDLVLVVGDVNSTLACALVAAKLNVPVAHVEAGLRSFDRSMPEEINRVLTDQIADLLFTTERSANENLHREGIPKSKIHYVGNTMIDTLLHSKQRALALGVLEELGLSPGTYGLLTLHRPSNVDVTEVFRNIVKALHDIQKILPIVFPAHPRTMQRIRDLGFENDFKKMGEMTLIHPLGYLEFLNLMTNAKLVLTDSGGIQEETTILGVPCLTLRENTERPVTVTKGTNTLVGSNPRRIVKETRRILRDGERHFGIPELWDGRASERIVSIILREMGE